MDELFVKSTIVDLEATQQAVAVWKAADFSELMRKYITFLFSIITGMALSQFAKSEFSDKVLSGKAPDFRNLVLFVACLFFVVSDWFFYQFLTTKYAYTNPKGVLRFSLDIVLFCLMYLLLYAATLSITTYRVLLIIGTLVAWHLLTQVWHIARLLEYPQDPLGFTHTYRAVGYATVLCFGIYYLKRIEPLAEIHRVQLERLTISCLIDCVVAMVFYFNGTRLWYFLTRGPYPSPKLRILDTCVCVLVGLLGLWYASRLHRECMDKRHEYQESSCMHLRGEP